MLLRFFCANKSNDNAYMYAWFMCSLRYGAHPIFSPSKLVFIACVNTLNMYVCFSSKKHNVGEAFGRETKSHLRGDELQLHTFEHQLFVLSWCYSCFVLLFRLIRNAVPTYMEQCSMSYGIVVHLIWNKTVDQRKRYNR